VVGSPWLETNGLTGALAQPVLLGRIVGLFGVNGWVKVFSYTQPREAILEYGQWYLKQDNEWRAAVIAGGKRHGKSIIASFSGVTDRDQAAELIGCDIAIEREDLPVPEVGRFYWADLEGLRVMDRDGAELGRVAYVMETGANDVLVLEGERERLIPFVLDKVVLDVDLARGVITVDWEWD
jgi:16S rRNA processing protein RimM